MGQYSDLYKLKAWKDLRRWRLLTSPLCVFCQAAGHATEATVADHIKPHKGDMGLFLAPSNLQSLCKPCHDRHKQRAERAGHDIRVDAEGFPIDPSHPFNAKAAGVATGEGFSIEYVVIEIPFDAPVSPPSRDYGPGGVGLVSGADRPGTGGGQPHALTQNRNQKGKTGE